MSLPFDHYLQHCGERVNLALAPALRGAHPVGDSALIERLQQAMHYSLLQGGKRIRPLLVYAAAEAVNPHSDATVLDHVAAAVEMIHAYSLIHDDLPAMDDDDLRRGQPTCHRAFDEATAILAGDALQARAFEILSELELPEPRLQLSLIRILAQAAGQHGMVGGQAIDLAAVDRSISLPHLETLHRLKTGALIRAAVLLGASIAGASAAQLQALTTYAEAIGLAFQVQDDILDIESDTATLGKRQGADLARNKPTYPSLLGLPAAKAKAQALHQQALDSLQGFDQRALRLRELSQYIVSRSH